MIEVRPVQTKHERNIFTTFPWRIYKNDPLWIPPILSDREKAMDPHADYFSKAEASPIFISPGKMASRSERFVRAGKRCEGKHVWFLRMP